jgi:hypothetical protein
VSIGGQKMSERNISHMDTHDHMACAICLPERLAAVNSPLPYAWCESCGYAHPVNDRDCVEATPAPLEHVIALLEADAANKDRDMMWRYGVKHALTLIRLYLGVTK